MDLLRSIETYVQVAECKSFSRAAQALRMSNAGVTRHIAQLEKVFGGRLIERNTRQIRLTQAGLDCLDHCRSVLLDLASAENAVREVTAKPMGTLRIIATSLYWMHEVSPRLPDFMRRYPDIHLHVHLTQRQPDLLAEDFDVSLQFLAPPGNTMIVRTIKPLPRVICAAPEYLEHAGTPPTVGALAAHNCLIYTTSDETVEWRFRTNSGEVGVSPRGSLRSSDALTLRHAALAGLGIVRSPLFLIDEDLKAGRLIRVLPEASSIDPDLCAVISSRKFVPLKLRVFLDFLHDSCGNHPTANGAHLRNILPVRRNSRVAVPGS
jgi:DNA-binding transcriptional LysR family regulator